jgi:hypothetical protein
MFISVTGILGKYILSELICFAVFSHIPTDSEYSGDVKKNIHVSSKRGAFALRSLCRTALQV